MYVETFTLDSDEDGWTLHLDVDVDTDQLVEAMTSGKLYFTIRDDVGLERGARRVVNHFDEGRRAYAAMAAVDEGRHGFEPADPGSVEPPDDGYEPDDPKSTGYHDRMSAAADL